MANVCQYGDAALEQNIWTVKSAGDGYYYLYSRLDGGEKYMLDVYYALADNGTNIGIYENTNSPAQLFRFADNGDGTCTVVTQASGGTSCIQTAGASKDANANVEEWTRSGSAEQKWIVHNVRFMGYKGDCKNEDDQINKDDVKRMTDHVMNREAFAGNPMEFIDMDGNGVINGFDLAILKRMAANREDWIPMYTAE